MSGFHQITEELVRNATGGRINIADFDRLAPKISQQIRMDVGSAWLHLWGYSLNFDEYERSRIVDRKILSVIGRIARYPIRDQQRYHAGLIHTYGYLFSNLQTRFGYKRARWCNGVLEKSLRLPAGFLSPAPQSGTLLRNVTTLMLAVAFPQLAQKMRDLPCDEIKRSLQNLRITRIQETTSLQRKTLVIHKNILHTQTGLDSVMIYSFQLGKERRLVTCFGMDRASRDSFEQLETGNQVMIRQRFNLSIPGFPVHGKLGTRSVQRQ